MKLIEKKYNTVKKQNILHLVEYLYLGGIERLLEQLANNSEKKANLFFFSYVTETLGGIGKHMHDKGFPVFIYNKKNGRDWALFFALARVIKENNINVIHTHDFGPMEYAVLLKIRFPGIRLVHTQHTLMNFIIHRKYTIFFQFASYFYHRIIGVSHFVKDTISQHCLFMNNSHFIVIPNGVDTDILKATDKSIENVEFTNEKKCLKLVSLSRISCEKNLNYIFNTCRLLKEAGIPFIFHHAGDAKTSKTIDEIKSYIKENKLDDNIIMHGFSHDAKSVLDLGKIFLSASKTEGHPVAVLEAMACEKICFCSDIPPHREMGEDVLHLFSIEDDLSLFRCLKNHFTNNSEQDEKERCQLGRRKIIEKFSIQKMVDSYIEQYN